MRTRQKGTGDRREDGPAQETTRIMVLTEDYEVGEIGMTHLQELELGTKLKAIKDQNQFEEARSNFILGHVSFDSPVSSGVGGGHGLSELVGKKRAMGHNFEALTEAADVGSAASFQGDELQQRKKQKVFRVDSERVKWKELIDARLKVPRNAAQTAKDKVGKVNEMAAVEGIGGITGLKDYKDIME